MSKKIRINDGYRPTTASRRGYQPQEQQNTGTRPIGRIGGYQPTNKGNNNPNDKPPPKKP